MSVTTFNSTPTNGCLIYPSKPLENVTYVDADPDFTGPPVSLVANNVSLE